MRKKRKRNSSIIVVNRSEFSLLKLICDVDISVVHVNLFVLHSLTPFYRKIRAELHDQRLTDYGHSCIYAFTESWKSTSCSVNIIVIYCKQIDNILQKLFRPIPKYIVNNLHESVESNVETLFIIFIRRNRKIKRTKESNLEDCCYGRSFTFNLYTCTITCSINTREQPKWSK